MNLFDNVTFVTYCCQKDIHKLYTPGALSALIGSHKCNFHEIILIRQHCRDIDVGLPEIECRVLEAEDYPDIRTEFHIVEDNPDAEHHTGPPNSKYYWKNHCWNQLIALKEATTEFVVMADCDTILDGDNPDSPWVGRGIAKLNERGQVFMVSPGHGSGINDVTRSISQIVILVNRDRFLNLDYETPLSEGGLGAFHFVWEGRVWRYAFKHNLRRLVLGNPRIIHYAW